MNNLSPLQAIKAFCRLCNGENSGGTYYDCLNRHCTFYPWKEGKGYYEPNTEQFVSNEHKEYLQSLGNNIVKKTRKGKPLSPEHKAKLLAGRLAKKAKNENTS